MISGLQKLKRSRVIVYLHAGMRRDEWGSSEIRCDGGRSGNFQGSGVAPQASPSEASRAPGAQVHRRHDRRSRSYLIAVRKPALMNWKEERHPCRYAAARSQMRRRGEGSSLPSGVWPDDLTRIIIPLGVSGSLLMSVVL